MDTAEIEDIQAFRAATMHEALVAVRESLGDDAVILETRSTPGAQIEILAGLQPNEYRDDSAGMGSSGEDYLPVEQPESPRSQYGALQHDDVPKRPELASPSSHPSRHPVDFDLDETPLQDRLAAIEEALRSLTRDRRGHGPIIDRLTQSGIPVGLARRIAINASGDDPTVPPTREALVAAIAEVIPCSDPPRIRPGQQRRIAVVGPTGVGKTTTLAKVAANFRIEQRLSVGLITMDDYRVAAADQLRTYAELMHCPIYVVTSNDEMESAIEALASCDVVLIDTPGFGTPGDDELGTLSDRLNIAGVVDRFLVVSTVSSLASTCAAAKRYRPLSPTAVIYTKLDETVEPGLLVGLCDEIRLPATFVTTGQDVPSDIQAADATTLAHMVLDRSVGQSQ